MSKLREEADRAHEKIVNEAETHPCDALLNRAITALEFIASRKVMHMRCLDHKNHKSLACARCLEEIARDALEMKE